MTDFATYPSLAGKTVLISGGSSGIGASHVEHFCAQGARVGFIDIDEAGGRAVVEQAADRGHARPDFLHPDLRDIEGIKRLVAGFIERAGDVEVLLNNAAHDQRHALEDVTPEYFDERIALNLKHLFFLAQAVVPGMKRRGRGSIVNFGSFSWRAGFGGMPVYVTAKAGIEGLTRGLARDLGPHNIRVNCVIPGWIMTQRQLDLWVDDAAKARINEMQCLKEPVYPADVARAALWLASDDARMCTSQTLVIDGGWI